MNEENAKQAEADEMPGWTPFLTRAPAPNRALEFKRPAWREPVFVRASSDIRPETNFAGLYWRYFNYHEWLAKNEPNLWTQKNANVATADMAGRVDNLLNAAAQTERRWTTAELRTVMDSAFSPSAAFDAERFFRLLDFIAKLSAPEMFPQQKGKIW